MRARADGGESSGHLTIAFFGSSLVSAYCVEVHP